MITWTLLASKTAHFLSFARQSGPKGVMPAPSTNFMFSIAFISTDSMVLKYPVWYNNRQVSLLLELKKQQPVKK
jgi:hypothetical protein